MAPTLVVTKKHDVKISVPLQYETIVTESHKIKLL